MIDGSDERYQVWKKTLVKKARSVHTCSECERTIAAGESYAYFTAGPSEDKGWDTYHTCAHCEVACDWLTEVCSGFLHTCVQEDIEEHAKEYRRGDLYRVAVRMKRKWTKKDGRLMPIPAALKTLEVAHG